MDSRSFTDRFKNKYEHIGRDGIFSIDQSKAIVKLDIPESKLHKPYHRLQGEKQEFNKLVEINRRQFSSTLNKHSNSYKVVKGIQDTRENSIKLLALEQRYKKLQLDCRSSSIISHAKHSSIPNLPKRSPVEPLPLIEKKSASVKLALKFLNKLSTKTS